MGASSSNPTHVSVSTRGVKPMNHASRLSLVVPVLPAAIWRKPSARTPAAVPRSITPFITLTRMYMSRAGNTCTGSMPPAAATTRLRSSVTKRMVRSGTREPMRAMVENESAISMGGIPTAPRSMAG